MDIIKKYIPKAKVDESKGQYIATYQQQEIKKSLRVPIIVINLNKLKKQLDVASTVVHELCHALFDKKYLIISDTDISFVDKQIVEGDTETYEMCGRSIECFRRQMLHIGNANIYMQQIISR